MMDKVYIWIPMDTPIEILVSVVTPATNCTLLDTTWVTIDEKVILMLIMGREIQKTTATIEVPQHTMGETKHWHSPLTSGLQKPEPRDRRTSICRWMRWKRSSAGEESSSQRMYSRRLCRLPRLLRLRSRHLKARQVPGTTAPSVCQARRARRRAAASSVRPRRQSRNPSQAGKTLFLQTRLRQPYRLQVTSSLDRTACQWRCRCTLRCLTILLPARSSHAHKELEIARAQPRNTIAVLPHLLSPCTPNIRHASIHHLVACGQALPAQIAPIKMSRTGTHTPQGHHYHPLADHARAQVLNIECQTTTLVRQCPQRKGGAVSAATATLMSTTPRYEEFHLALRRWLPDLARHRCITLTLPSRVARAAV